jgi:transposase
MPRLCADAIVMSAADEQALTRLVRAHGTPQKLAERAQLILLGSVGTGVRETARQLGVWPKTVRHWLRRWRTADEATPAAERLADAPRPGAPATFTPEQICAIVALACEHPLLESGLPLSHWSRSELAQCAVERGIVEGISESSVGRFFKEAALQPHRVRGWLTSKPDPEFESNNAPTSAKCIFRRRKRRNRASAPSRSTR